MRSLLLTIVAVLVILITDLPSVAQDRNYYGAEIRTTDSYKYGKFEVRMKSVNSSGMLCSFFTFYDQPDFTSNWNEIDIEILGRYNNEVQFNVITPGPAGRSAHEKRYTLPFDPHADFHTYAFAWTPDYIAFEVDGAEVYRDTGKHVKDMNRPQKIMMNIWISKWIAWTGKWQEGKFPLEAMYDYVKYYSYNPKNSEQPFQLKWEDDFNRFNSSRWQFATHTFDGNLVQFIEDNGSFEKGVLKLSITKAGESKYIDRYAEEEEKPAEKLPLTLESGYFRDNKIHLFFSNKLNRKIGNNPENYQVEGFSIQKVSLFADYRTTKQEVIIHLDKNIPADTILDVRVKQIVDVHGQVLNEAAIDIKEKE